MPAMLIQWLLLLVTSWAESPGRGKTSRTLTLAETRRGCASSRRMGTELVGRSVLGDIPKGHGGYRARPLGTSRSDFDLSFFGSPSGSLHARRLPGRELGSGRLCGVRVPGRTAWVENKGRHLPRSSWGQRRNLGTGGELIVWVYHVYNFCNNFHTKP